MTIPEACKQLAETIKKIAKETNQTMLFGDVQIEGEKDWNCDSCVILKLQFPNGAIYDTGYMISPIIEQKAQRLGQEQTDFIRYYVQHEEVTRGVYMYPDGSGEPDTSDVVDDVATDNLSKAATEAVILVIRFDINRMFESEAEEAMAKQAIEDEKELDEMYKDMVKKGMI